MGQHRLFMGNARPADLEDLCIDEPRLERIRGCGNGEDMETAPRNPNLAYPGITILGRRVSQEQTSILEQTAQAVVSHTTGNYEDVLGRSARKFEGEGQGVLVMLTTAKARLIRSYFQQRFGMDEGNFRFNDLVKKHERAINQENPYLTVALGGVGIWGG